MNQYEKSQALHLIDGYWIPRPAASETRLSEDFTRAKQDTIAQLNRTLQQVGEITIEEFREYKGLAYPAN